MNGDDNGELPEGWAFAQFGEVADVIGGGTPKSTEVDNFSTNGIPWITPADLSDFHGVWLEKGERGLTQKGYEGCSARMLPRGAVLLSSRAPIGYVAVAANPLCTNQGFKSFVLPAGIDPEFVFYWLKYQRDAIEELGSGSTFLEISGARCKEIPLHVAPLAEQRRIVAAVGAVLAKVSAARERLNRVPALLKRFRQAVLAAACSGRLTADWREQNPTVSPSAAEWIYSTDEKRRATTEGQKLRRLGEPYPALIDDLSGWCSTRVGEITECLDHLRIPVKKENRGAGNVPYYGANGRTGWTDQHLFDEDLVLVVEDESFIGRERPFSYVVRGKSWVNNHAHALRPLGGMSADYLDTILAYYDFVPLTSGTTGRRKLNQAALLAAPLNIAPPQEQTEIVRRVDELFALADTIEVRLAEARRSADRLTQAVLAKAFRGELVPTEAELARRENRTYEPATDLLARVRATRTQPDTRPARPRKPKSSTE